MGYTVREPHNTFTNFERGKKRIRLQKTLQM